MKNKKFIIILVIIIAVLIIGMGVIFAILYLSEGKEGIKDIKNRILETNVNSDQQINTNSTTNTNTSVIINLNNSNNTNIGNVNTNIEPKDNTTEQQAMSLAKSFVERYGSFSNQNDYENLLNLKIFMTNKMQSRVDDIIDDYKNNASGNLEYYGIVTKVISTNTVSFDKNDAKFLIACQRRENKAGEEQANIYFQDISLELKTESGSWKINNAEWQ